MDVGLKVNDLVSQLKITYLEQLYGISLSFGCHYYIQTIKKKKRLRVKRKTKKKTEKEKKKNQPKIT